MQEAFPPKGKEVPENAVDRAEQVRGRGAPISEEERVLPSLSSKPEVLPPTPRNMLEQVHHVIRRYSST
jgi:hypothetical protein